MNDDRAPRSVRFNRLLFMALVLAGVSVAPTLAADSIYLKNGRVIRTSSAEIVGDRVMFTQFGHPIAIPMSQVDRIVDDDYEDPVATPSAAQPEDGSRRQHHAYTPLDILDCLCRKLPLQQVSKEHEQNRA